jgi:pseudouridylate synthase
MSDERVALTREISQALTTGQAVVALESTVMAQGLPWHTGKSLTPFLLDSIHQATEGRGLRANCALLEANARLAAEVATALIDSV